MEHGRRTAGRALIRRMVWIAVALILADLVTTLVAVRHVGADAEANVLFRGVIARHGLALFIALYLAIAGTLVFLFSLAEYFLIGFIAVLAVILLNNIYALIRLFMS
jgi:hypothetical protein